MKAIEPIIWRREVQQALGVTGETMRTYLRNGKLPALDVNLSTHKQGWYAATLAEAGIKIEAAANQQMPAASAA